MHVIYVVEQSVNVSSSCVILLINQIEIPEGSDG